VSRVELRDSGEKRLFVQLYSPAMSTAEACSSLVEALEARRTDILKALLDHLASGQAGATRGEVLHCTALHCTALHCTAPH
jgi:hypothetical protein